jgi:hypothetical protein
MAGDPAGVDALPRAGTLAAVGSGCALSRRWQYRRNTARASSAGAARLGSEEPVSGSTRRSRVPRATSATAASRSPVAERDEHGVRSPGGGTRSARGAVAARCAVNTARATRRRVRDRAGHIRSLCSSGSNSPVGRSTPSPIGRCMATARAWRKPPLALLSFGGPSSDRCSATPRRWLATGQSAMSRWGTARSAGRAAAPIASTALANAPHLPTLPEHGVRPLPSSPHGAHTGRQGPAHPGQWKGGSASPRRGHRT